MMGKRTVEELALVAQKVRDAPGRNDKTSLLAEFLQNCSTSEVPIAVGWLSGQPRQGRVGVGWAALKEETLTNLNRTSNADPVSISYLDQKLTDLALLSGDGVVERRRDVLAELFAAISPEAESFVRAVLSGGLRQGASVGVVTSAIAKGAGVQVGVLRRAAMLSGDLPLTARLAFESGAEGLRAVGLQVGTAVAPMLAASSPTVTEAIEELGDSVLQAKLDGIRIQAHKDGDSVELFTRSLRPVADSLPHIAEIVRKLPVDRVVLDGEVIGWSEPELGEAGEKKSSPDEFADIASTFSSGGSSERSELAVAFFDVLHVDDEDLIDAPLAARLDVLASVAGPLCVDSLRPGSAAAAEQQHHDWVAQGLEGTMVKAIDSVYAAGRRGKTWRKVKPVLTFDMVVLAAEWGHGRRTGKLSNIHLGVRDDTGEQVGNDDGLVMVGKTFKGMTDAMLEWQTATFLEHERSRSGITVAIEPINVVEIAIDGVQRSTTYPGGIALRFARVKSYRHDKSPTDADTLSALRALLS